MNTVMEIDNVEKSYGTSQILNHCCLKLYEGEIYGLLGINGAGKTTLMKMILNLQKIDNGRIFILGKEISGDYRFFSDCLFYRQLDCTCSLLYHSGYAAHEYDICSHSRCYL